MRRRCFDTLEVDIGESLSSRIVDGTLIWLIVLNVAAAVLETVDHLYGRYVFWFTALELFSVAVFTAEYIVRLWISVEHVRYPSDQPIRSRLRYMRSPMAIIDLLAIAPFYMVFLGLDFRMLRVFRLFRLFKLLRFSPAIYTLGRVLYVERRAILAAGVIMLSLITFAATGIYYLEHTLQPYVFGSIPQAMWWAIATLTTVGYGDAVPLTVGGRMFGGLVMIFGLGMFALPIGIIASGFANEIRQRDFVFTWDTLANVPLFAGLDAASLSHIADLLTARIFAPGQRIIERGATATCMFFVISGKVELRRGDNLRTVGAGEFFGEIAILRDSPVFRDATAAGQCRLMILAKQDFFHLLGEHPEISQALLGHIDDSLEDPLSGFGQLSAVDVEKVRETIRAASTSPP